LPEKFGKGEFGLSMMPGILPKKISLGSFPSAVVTVNQAAFVLPLENLLAEATATHIISISKITS